MPIDNSINSPYQILISQTNRHADVVSSIIQEFNGGMYPSVYASYPVGVYTVHIRDSEENRDILLSLINGDIAGSLKYFGFREFRGVLVFRVET